MGDADPDVLNVLVLDDEPALLDLYTRLLLPQGHQIFAVGSAEEALQLLPFTTFQVAFVDHHLPGIEGAVLVDYLRKNNPRLEIALVTGADDEELARYSIPEGVTVIKKPFEISQLLDRISAYQGQQAERRDQDRAEAEVDYQPQLGPHLSQLAETYAVPKIAARLEERLIQVVRTALANLRSKGRYDERERVTAYAGLVTLSVLSVRPPKAASGRTLFGEYDALMRLHGRAPAFGNEPD